ncbi:MAG: peptidylprolyl isomerase [Thermoanaerobaculia bacterium]
MKRFLVLVLLLLSACTSTAPQPVQALPPQVEMATTAGSLTIRLLPENAPATVAQFLKLVRGGVYDSTYFYRVEPRFVAQTATADDREIPLTDEQRGLIRPIVLEAGPVKHQRGVISLAHGDDPNGGETSFSILLADAPHLDGRYTVFGVIVDSGDILHEIEETFDQQARNAEGARLQIVKMTVR